MADLSRPAPIEETKAGAYLHDRSNRPTAPKPAGMELVKRYLPILLGVVGALAIEAVAFQTRASWTTHRDWVVPMLTPGFVIGGVAIGHLLSRREWDVLMPAGLFALIAVGIALADAAMDSSDSDAGLRDAFAIANAFVIAFLILAAVLAVVWVEWKRPTRAPAPQA